MVVVILVRLLIFINHSLCAKYFVRHWKFGVNKTNPPSFFMELMASLILLGRWECGYCGAIYEATLNHHFYLAFPLSIFLITVLLAIPSAYPLHWYSHRICLNWEIIVYGFIEQLMKFEYLIIQDAVLNDKDIPHVPLIIYCVS